MPGSCGHHRHRGDPERVWDVLADLAAYSEWNPFARSAPGQLAEGARLTLRLAPPGGRAMTFRPTVLTAESGQLLRWIGRLIVPGVSGTVDPVTGYRSYSIGQLRDLNRIVALQGRRNG
jgi:hypothetical protein